VLRLSRRGKRIDDVCASRIDAVMGEALARMDPGDVAATRRVLTTLAEALGDEPQTERRRGRSEERPHPE
jgi:hypothetical protein